MGAGSASGMITSLKNNKRPRVSAFKKIKAYQNVKYKDVIINKKATPEQLKRIRDKIRKENKESFTKTIFYTIVAGIILFILFNFATF